MSSAPFLIWLFCIGVSALMIGVFIKTGGLKQTLKKEGFEGGGIRITVCPVGSTQYINKEGDTHCCNGDIVNGECGGTNMCTLSPTSKSIISCSEWLRQEWQRRSRRFCPRYMYNYFGTISRTTGTEGCSTSQCNITGSEPSDPNAEKCIIYKTDELNYGKIDSCVNILERDNMRCPQANASKQIIPMGRGQDGSLNPALLKCNYSPVNNLSINLPVDCYNDERYTRLIRYSNRNNSANLESMLSYINRNDLYNKDVMFCPASKAHYVDKTLTRENAWGLPGAPSTSKVCPAAPACPPPPVCPTSKTDKIINAATAGANKAKDIAKAGISNIRNRLKR